MGNIISYFRPRPRQSSGSSQTNSDSLLYFGPHFVLRDPPTIAPIISSGTATSSTSPGGAASNDSSNAPPILLQSGIHILPGSVGSSAAPDASQSQNDTAGASAGAQQSGATLLTDFGRRASEGPVVSAPLREMVGELAQNSTDPLRNTNRANDNTSGTSRHSSHPTSNLVVRYDNVRLWDVLRSIHASDSAVLNVHSDPLTCTVAVRRASIVLHAATDAPRDVLKTVRKEAEIKSETVSPSKSDSTSVTVENASTESEIVVSENVVSKLDTTKENLSSSSKNSESPAKNTCDDVSGTACDLIFTFDADEPCEVSVYFIAEEIDNNVVSHASAPLPEVVSKQFQSCMRQSFSSSAVLASSGAGKKIYVRELRKQLAQISETRQSAVSLAGDSAPPGQSSAGDGDRDQRRLLYHAIIVIRSVVSNTQNSADRKTLQFHMNEAAHGTRDSMIREQRSYIIVDKAGRARCIKQKLLDREGVPYIIQEVYGYAENNALTDKAAVLAQVPLTTDGAEDNHTTLPQTPTLVDEVEGGSSPPPQVVENAQPECIVCFSEEKNTIVLPCRHLCLCKDCALQVRKQTRKCPICRQDFHSLLQIDLTRVREAFPSVTAAVAPSAGLTITASGNSKPTL